MIITFIADIHLGNPRIDPHHLHESLKLVLYPAIATSDIFVIGGDFFDTLFPLDSRIAITSLLIFREMCQLAQENNVAIRVIRGTFTHDRDQLKQLAKIAERYPIDFAYYDKISVDTCKGFTCGYLPDNLPYQNAKEVCDILDKTREGLYQDTPFDFVFGHGYFDHMLQFEGHKPAILYTADMFDKVKEFVCFGHIHTRATKANVVYSGSFERLNHGEEEPKGFLIIDTDDHVCSFARNIYATNMYTLYPVGENIDEKSADLDTKIRKKYGEYPNGYLRIAASGEDRGILTRYFSEKYKDKLVVTSLDTDIRVKDKKVSNALSEGFTTFMSDIPTKDNLAFLMEKYITKNKDSLSISEDAYTYLSKCKPKDITALCQEILSHAN